VFAEFKQGREEKVTTAMLAFLVQLALNESNTVVATAQVITVLISSRQQVDTINIQANAANAANAANCISVAVFIFTARKTVIEYT
jgi:hypothetical protein